MKLMHLEFDPTAPELFPWTALDSRVASRTGERIARIIHEELQHPPEERFRVPGLRRALSELAAVVIEIQREDFR